CRSDTAPTDIYTLSLHDALPISRTCWSVKVRGACRSEIREVILNGMPKCLARQVTCSPKPMLPLVTPATACSPDSAMEPVCASIDRKSTRLNSSHVKISYAVFCL